MKRLIPLILTVVLVAAACGDDSSSTDAGGPGTGEPTTSTVTPTTTVVTTTSAGPDTPEGALAAARERWAANGPRAYRLTTSEICFCDVIEWVNTVIDGEVVSHEAVNEGTLFDPGPRSMETIFDEIAAAIAEGYETLDAEYDAETGAVVRYYVDGANVADEEYGVQVISLTPFDPDAEPVDIDASTLVDDHGCGFGFAKSDATQTLALFIYWTGGYDPIGPDVSAPIVLPADDWEATMTTGASLFADWCNDVIEPGAPVPVIDETLTVIAGTLTVDADPAAQPCVGEAVTGVLTGAIAEFSDGTTVELDDVTLRNFGWGCFAG